MLVILRDGRKLHGVLRSYDQFGALPHFTAQLPHRRFNCGAFFCEANLVLEDTVERIHHGDTFAENWHGLFLIRGENVVLLGEIVCLILSCYAGRWLKVVPGFRQGGRRPPPTGRLSSTGTLRKKRHRAQEATRRSKSQDSLRQKGLLQRGRRRGWLLMLFVFHYFFHLVRGHSKSFSCTGTSSR